MPLNSKKPIGRQPNFIEYVLADDLFLGATPHFEQRMEHDETPDVDNTQNTADISIGPNPEPAKVQQLPEDKKNTGDQN